MAESESEFIFFQPSFSESTRPISTKFSRNLWNCEHSDSIETEFLIFVYGGRRVEKKLKTRKIPS